MLSDREKFYNREVNLLLGAIPTMAALLEALNAELFKNIYMNRFNNRQTVQNSVQGQTQR